MTVDLTGGVRLVLANDIHGLGGVAGWAELNAAELFARLREDHGWPWKLFAANIIEASVHDEPFEVTGLLVYGVELKCR